MVRSTGERLAWDFASLDAARSRATFSCGVSLGGPGGILVFRDGCGVGVWEKPNCGEVVVEVDPGGFEDA